MDGWKAVPQESGAAESFNCERVAPLTICDLEIAVCGESCLHHRAGTDWRKGMTLLTCTPAMDGNAGTARKAARQSSSTANVWRSILTICDSLKSPFAARRCRTPQGSSLAYRMGAKRRMTLPLSARHAEPSHREKRCFMIPGGRPA